MDSGGIWVFFLTDKTSYHKPLKWDKIWDNPNREVRYDVDKMESGLEKPYWLQRIAGKRFVEVVEVRGNSSRRGIEPPIFEIFYIKSNGYNISCKSVLNHPTWKVW